MILIEIEVPILGKVWDAKVREQETVEKIIQNLVRIFGDQQEEHREQYLLVWPDRQWILEKDKTLEYYGIENGDTVMLV